MDEQIVPFVLSVLFKEKLSAEVDVQLVAFASPFGDLSEQLLKTGELSEEAFEKVSTPFESYYQVRKVGRPFKTKKGFSFNYGSDEDPYETESLVYQFCGDE